MFGFEGYVIWLLVLASLGVVRRAAVDLWAQIHGRPAPSVDEREKRLELAQRQREANGGVPSPRQAAADRIANWIVEPPPQPDWIAKMLTYFATLLGTAFANATRRLDARQQEHEHGEARSRGPFCWRCERNGVAHEDDLCKPCAERVLSPCGGCNQLTPVAKLHNGRCETCRRSAPARPEPANPDAAIRLVLPAWLPAD